MANILVIDDDDSIRFSLKMALEDANHQVDASPDGAAGLALFVATAPDLVITDIFMPEKEGLETIDAIKRIRPETKIIAISGGGHMDPNDYLNIAKRIGADCTLTKPFNIQVLVDAVNALLTV